MNKKILKLIALIFAFLLFAGCGSEAAQTFSYNDFKNEFTSFVDNFKSENYTGISPEGLVVKTVSFPENRIDSRQADIIDGKSLSPVRYETLFESNDKNILVKVNFIYLPECRKKQFITINSFSPVNDINISEEHKDIVLPLMDEYLISMNGYLILINFIDVNRNATVTDEYCRAFIDSTLKFYKDFETALLKEKG